MSDVEKMTRECTCHPDDSPPKPCPQKYALQDCRSALPPRAVQSKLGKVSMTDTLSPERVAEIRARVALINDPTFIGRSEIGEHVRTVDLPALLASHEALRAEVERLRAVADSYLVMAQNLGKETTRYQTELTTARDTAAREMREACATAVEAMDHSLAEIYCDSCHSTSIHPQTAADTLRALPLPSETKERGS